MGGWDWMMRGWAAYGLDQCDQTIGITDGQVIMQKLGFFSTNCFNNFWDC